MNSAVRLEATYDEPKLFAEITSCIKSGKSIRRDLPNGGRVHIDRPLPFLCVHIGEENDQQVARETVRANASYVIAKDMTFAARLVDVIAKALQEKFGSFLLFEIAEFETDRFLTKDVPFLQSFEVALWSSSDENTRLATNAFAKAVKGSEIRFRTPKVEIRETTPQEDSHFLSSPDHCFIKVRFAPVYKQPGSQDIYPELYERLIAMMSDAGLQAFASFINYDQPKKLTTHRALGRKAFVDAVVRTDRNIDEVASAFDFLLAVTPINAEAAFREFEESGFKKQPTFLYRPLSYRVDAVKKKLFSISFDHLEDPVLYQLYREKQQELDLQLSMLAARRTPKFVEFSRALYGPVEPSLLTEARKILDKSATASPVDGGEKSYADCFYVESRARAMIASYHRELKDFDVSVELRDDLPSGLMVSGHRLLISRSTKMDMHRVEPLLSHEIGVHLLTYFNGSAQGLRLFRTGLAGYEGMQEGLAVFSEYLSGGMTRERLRLIAARVVACADMLNGASFADVYGMLRRDHGFTEAGAFNLTLRIYRGGGLSKDAIYLRGLLELLNHLRHGGELGPFWMGKIAASHFKVMEELATRGLLRRPSVRPAFLQHAVAQDRLEYARAGIEPLNMIQPEER
jgi:uncharacterized protein (TIGR02421 family)